MAHSNTPKKSIQGSSPTIDGYAIVEKVGSGSYSTVYKGFKTVNYYYFYKINFKYGTKKAMLVKL